ncbi:MAG: DUF3105 domain-containing protein [Kofleriaceae bacterium]
MNRALVVLALAACGDDGGVDEPMEMPVGECDGVLHSVPQEVGAHVPTGSSIEWSSNPPATGPHFPSWAGWDRIYENLDRGYWLHNAEHGGVVLLYNCPEGCPDVLDELVEVARNASPDETCTAPVTKRIIIAADPLLPAGTQVAAVAWNRYYTASCVGGYVGVFARANYRRGPEDTCADGVPFGGVPITPP